MDDRLFVSTRKGLLQLARKDGSWSIQRTDFLGHNVTLALVDARDESIYAALDLGHFGVKLHRSTDAGTTWEELPVPVYPEGEEIATGDGKPPAPANLKLIWSLETGSDQQPGRIWAGTAPGGLFRSDDAGQSWHLMRGLWDRPERKQWFGGGYDTPGIHSICVDPRNADVLRVAVSCAGVWTTTDGGESWNVTAEGMRAEYMPPDHQMDPNVQDPHRMVQCPVSPDTLWVQHHNGIFRSTDGAKTWHEFSDVKPSAFGFAVAVHPHDPNTAWFIPAVKDECRVPVDGRLVVTRTRDGGKSFEQLTEGLPSTSCFDLVYRHALDVDTTGQRLAFGSTTGGLWLSEDAGETWQMVSAHLAPIHAVCFG